MATNPVRIKSFPEIWEADRELVKLSYPDVDLPSLLPTSSDVALIYQAQTHRWRNPPDPFRLTEDSFADVAKGLIPEIEEVIGARLIERPVIEIVPASKYLQRINELEREANSKLGGELISQSPPTMGVFPYTGTFVIPEVYLVRVPKTRNIDPITGDFDVVELMWDRAYFEEVVCESISSIVLRQQRGEWKEDYERLSKVVDGGHHVRAEILRRSASQHVKETIARSKRAQWGVYVVVDKLHATWQNPLYMNDYRGIDVLANERSLATIIMADALVVTEEGVGVAFDSRHPQNMKKQRAFQNYN